MTTRKILFAALCSALMAAAATASAMPTREAKNTCVFSKYDASSVAPYKAEENFGYGTYTKLRGAQLFVPAREGLTEQWLTREVQGALSARSEGTCKPNVDGVKVQVVSAGPGFWVQLIAANERSGNEVLSWARGLVASRSARK